MIKDSLTSLVPVAATDKFHISTLQTRLNQLIVRDEELALLLAGVSTTTTALESTGKHEITGDKTVNKGVTSGWLTRIPAYSRVGKFTTPITFAAKDQWGNPIPDRAGIPRVYPCSRTSSIFGNDTTTYVMDASGQITETRPRSAEEMKYGNVSGSGTDTILPVGKTFDNGTCFAHRVRPSQNGYKWISNPSEEQIYVIKEDTTRVVLNSVLPAGIGEYYAVILSADGSHVFVCTKLSTSNNNYADTWYLIRYTGSSAILESQGVIGTNIISDYCIGNSSWELGYSAMALESDHKTLWQVYAAGNTKVSVLTIGTDKVLRAETFPTSYGSENTHFTPAYSYPGMFADNGVCTLISEDSLVKLSRSPSKEYYLNSGYLQFDGVSNVISSTDNMAQLNFGTGDFCIEVLMEPNAVSNYTILSTNLWSLKVISGNPGPGTLVISNPGQNFSNIEGVVFTGKPIHIVYERYNGVMSVYIQGWRKALLNNASAVYETPTYLKVGGPSPYLSGKIYAVRITSGARYKDEYQMEELAPGSSDSLWNSTMYLLRVDIGAIYKRRELLDSRGKLPEGWTVTKIGEGVFVVSHDLGTSDFSVVPMSFTYGTKITTSNYTSTTFQVNVFGKNGSPLDSDFSCMVFLG